MGNIPAYQLLKWEIERYAAVDKTLALFYKLCGPLKSNFDEKTTINLFLHAETFRNAHCKNAVFYDLVKDAKCCPLACPQEDTLNNFAKCSLIVLLPTPKKIQCTKKYSVEKKVGCLTLEDSVIRERDEDGFGVIRKKLADYNDIYNDAIVTQHGGQLMLIILKDTTNIQVIYLLIKREIQEHTNEIQVYGATYRVGDIFTISKQETLTMEPETLFPAVRLIEVFNDNLYLDITKLKQETLTKKIETFIRSVRLIEVSHDNLYLDNYTLLKDATVMIEHDKLKQVTVKMELDKTWREFFSKLSAENTAENIYPQQRWTKDNYTLLEEETVMILLDKLRDVTVMIELEEIVGSWFSSVQREVLTRLTAENTAENIYPQQSQQRWTKGSGSSLQTLCSAFWRELLGELSAFNTAENIYPQQSQQRWTKGSSGQPLGGGHGCNYFRALGKKIERAWLQYGMIDVANMIDETSSVCTGRLAKEFLSHFLSPVNDAGDCLFMDHDFFSCLNSKHMCNVLRKSKMVQQLHFPCVVSWLSECSLELVTTDSNKLDTNLSWGPISLAIKNKSLFWCSESDYNNTHVSSVKQFISEKAISGKNYVNNRSKANDYVNGEYEILRGIPGQSDSDVKGSWEDSKELHVDSLHTVQAEIVTSVAKQQPYRIVLADDSKLNTAIDRPELDIAPETYMAKSANLIKLTRENETSHAMIVPIDNTVTIHSRSKTNVSLSEEEFYHLVDPQSSLHSDKSVLMNSCELLWLPSLPLPVPQMDITVAIMQASTQAPQFPELMTILQQLADGEPVSAHVTMRYELLRVCTLKNYPKKGKIYLTLLAGAGFYYAGDEDELICYCCGVRRRNWTAQEKPRAVHVRMTPLCKFLKDNKTVNVPVPIQNHEKFSKIDAIPDLPRHELVNQQAPEDVSNDHVRAGSRTTAEAQGAQTAAARLTPTAHSSTSGAFAAQIPKYPQYATRAARLATYQGWPMETSCPRSEQLSEAGFFYAGVGDCVRCFFCGIGLRHWTEDDDPWVEHARFGKTCLYLRKKKGEEFIREIQQAYERRSNGVDVKNTSESNHPEDVMARHLLSDAAQSVLGMGYQPSIIKQGIQALISGGDRKFSAQELMEKILDIEEAAKASASSPPTGNAASTRPTSSRPPLVVGAAPVSCGVAAGNATAVDTQPTAIVSDGNSMDSKKEAGKTNSAAQTKKRETTKINFKGSNATDKMTGKQLREENERLREQSQCRVCLNNPTNTVFLPCGHLVTCTDCAAALRNCPICRTLIKGTVKTYAD